MPENQPCPDAVARLHRGPRPAVAARRLPPHRHPEPGSVPRILVVVGRLMPHRLQPEPRVSILIR